MYMWSLPVLNVERRVFDLIEAPSKSLLSCIPSGFSLPRRHSFRGTGRVAAGQARPDDTWSESVASSLRFGGHSGDQGGFYSGDSTEEEYGVSIIKRMWMKKVSQGLQMGLIWTSSDLYYSNFKYPEPDF
ncbi:hypothetical protein ARMSODRAFT_1005092 [Armillaria solidipes]|uniref:Uncharacterized protein n=1 Tax=Armillaria solidipes TaxID=1076256 RepID=A0A2H3BBB5_9AGAR|nr:hypothetical protein ARMSODRAFT_1005092 [Armillaria solidipes]